MTVAHEKFSLLLPLSHIFQIVDLYEKWWQSPQFPDELILSWSTGYSPTDFDVYWRCNAFKYSHGLVFPMLCCIWVRTIIARLLGVIICWIVFVSSLLTDHLKNTEQEHMESLGGLLPSEMGEIVLMSHTSSLKVISSLLVSKWFSLQFSQDFLQPESNFWQLVASCTRGCLISSSPGWLP